jgi:zinc transport system substrate-binding protein
MSRHSPARRRALASLCLLAAAPLVRAGATASSPLRIVASNYPLAYFAERLAGARGEVDFPAPPGVDPAFWRPDAKAVGRMQRADLIVLNGADYEKWLPHVSLPRLKTVDTSAGFREAYIRIENAVTHSHGPGGTHSHAGTAFTTWLDFDQARQQAEALAEALGRKRPEWQGLVAENLASLKADLAALDAGLKAVAAARPGLPLLASHPVYHYLARRYGLNLKSVHWEPDEMPPAGEWSALQKALAGHPAQWMLWEAEPNPDIAAKLKGLGVGSLVFDPGANRPESGDFLTVMQRNVENLKTAFSFHSR